jgi:hypothetical protein
MTLEPIASQSSFYYVQWQVIESFESKISAFHLSNHPKLKTCYNYCGQVTVGRAP